MFIFGLGDGAAIGCRGVEFGDLYQVKHGVLRRERAVLCRERKATPAVEAAVWPR